jgi:voltage-gated sodium channel
MPVLQCAPDFQGDLTDMTFLRKIVESPRFAAFITALILFNGVTLGLATSASLMAEYGAILNTIDGVIVAIFTVEIIMRIAVHRLAFFKDPWSLFDFSVVAISLVPASGELSILRVLRVLRLFRLLTIVPQMRRIIAALVSVIPGIGSISLIVGLFFYVFAIMATGLFGERFPEWFGTLGESMYTLFQIMTLESWSMGIARPVMEAFPYAWLFFIIFILLVTFIMVNLLIGIIVDAIFALKEETNEADPSPDALQKEIAELKRLLAAVERKLP